jgi:glutathione S-transferase
MSSSRSAFFFHYGTPGWGTELPKYKAPEWKARGEWAHREADKAQEGMRYFNKLLADRPFVTVKRSRCRTSRYSPACTSPRRLI